MTKKALDAFVLEHARFAREQMIKHHGSFRQQVIAMDLRGKLHVFVIADEVLHGKRMRDMLLVYTVSIGGADAFVIMSDARMKAVPKEELRKYEDAVGRGEYLIADDPRNKEVLMCFGRSREHTAAIMQPYRREKSSKGDVILFDEPEPRFDPALTELETSMIPNIWSHAS